MGAGFRVSLCSSSPDPTALWPWAGLQPLCLVCEVRNNIALTTQGFCGIKQEPRASYRLYPKPGSRQGLVGPFQIATVRAIAF